MRQGARRVVAIALIGLLTGCDERSSSVGAIAVTEADSAGVRVVTISGTIAALPEWSLSSTPLTEISGNAPPFHGRVGDVAFLGRQDLLVVDNQAAQLRSFTADGKVLQLLAGPGDGPGEIRAVTRLSVTPGDTVYAFDVRENRVSEFGPGGGFLTAIPIRPEFAGPGTLARDAWALGADRFLLYGPVLGEAGRPEGAPHRVVRDVIIEVVSGDGAERASPIHLAGGYNVRGTFGEAFSPFSNRPFVTVNAGRILHGSGLTYELVIRDFELRPLMAIRWQGWPQQPLTAPMIEALRDTMDASLEQLRSVAPDAAAALMEGLFHPDVLEEAMPAWGSALLDENGRIWVSRFRPPTHLPAVIAGESVQWDEEDSWHVLDAAGTPLARVRLPPATRLVAVRSDRVAVVTRDSLAVEHVRVLQIKEGGAAR